MQCTHGSGYHNCFSSTLHSEWNIVLQTSVLSNYLLYSVCLSKVDFLKNTEGNVIILNIVN